MAPVTALPVQPVAPATHTRMAIIYAPFLCPSFLLDSTTFSGGLYTQLSSFFTGSHHAQSRLSVVIFEPGLQNRNRSTFVRLHVPVLWSFSGKPKSLGECNNTGRFFASFMLY